MGQRQISYTCTFRVLPLSLKPKTKQDITPKKTGAGDFKDKPHLIPGSTPNPCLKHPAHPVYPVRL